MNAFYICCIADPFLDVANMLDEQYGVKPVYWVGDRDSAREGMGNEEDVKKYYPHLQYQKYYDAYRGVFPDEVVKMAQSMFVDIEILQQFAKEELQAISMMDRLDYDQHSFSFMERERYYLS